MSSNLTSKPCWLSSHESETGKVENIDFGFDNKGMWFSGDAGGGSGGEGEGGGYPIRSVTEFETNDICEVIYTVDYQDGCSDQGICIFNTGTEPEWQWGSNETRIAFSMNCPTPYIYGRTNETDGEGGELEGGEGDEYVENYYTFHFTYNPSEESLEVIVYQGENIEGTVVNTLNVSEKLPEGNYKIGFSADQDNMDKKAYFTNIQILKNGQEATGIAQEYTYDFSPDHPETIPNYRYYGEGNLDTAVIVNEDGTRRSVQRTGYFDYLDGCGNRKVMKVKDGDTVTDAPETPSVPPNTAGHPTFQ
jgi:hypothetical protein